MSQRLAFIGLGIMGLPMAKQLRGGGHELVVHSRTKSRARELLEMGCSWADSAAEAARGAEVVFICVTDTPDVVAVIGGENGVAKTIGKGAVVVDHSTISPSATREMAAMLAAKGAAMLDAPVSGGDVGAREGTLSIMVGGDEAAFGRVRALLQLMGKTITHCGPSGAGQLTKLVNQILVSVTCMGVCEALAFAIRNGLDPNKTIAAVGGGAGGSWQLANLGPKMVARDWKPAFMIDLQLKDMKLILEAAEQRGGWEATPASELVTKLLTMAKADGHGRDGTQSEVTVFERLAEGK